MCFRRFKANIFTYSYKDSTWSVEVVDPTLKSNKRENMKTETYDKLDIRQRMIQIFAFSKVRYRLLFKFRLSMHET